MSYIQNNDPYKEKTSTQFLEFFSDKEVNNTQNSKKDMDAYSAFKNSVSIKYKEGQKNKERKNTKPLETLIETDLTHSSHVPPTILPQSSNDHLQNNGYPEQYRNNSGTKKSNDNTKLSNKKDHITNNTGTEAEQLRNKRTEQQEGTTIDKKYRNNSGTNNQKIRNSSGTESGTIPEQKVEQFRNSTGTKTASKNRFYTLKGLGKDILFFIGEICINSGSLIAPPISYEEIAYKITPVGGKTSSPEVIRKTIYRLRNNGFLERIDGTRGKHGVVILALDEFVYKEILLQIKIEDNSGTVPEQFRNNKNNALAQSTGTDSGTNLSSSSSININNNNITTTNNMEFENFFKNLQELNPSILLNSQNVRKNEILNIYNARSSITPEEFVNSLEDFCYDIENGILKNITIPRSLFVKIMKMENYESEIRVKKDTEIIEQQRIRKDKAKQDLLKAQIALFPDEYKKEYEAWSNFLTDEKFEAITGCKKEVKNDFAENLLKNEFGKKVWPNIFKSLSS